MRKLFLMFLVLLVTSLTYGQQLNKLIQQAPRTPSGHIRCLSYEIDAAKRHAHPQRQSIQDFENWLAPHIVAYKQANASNAALPILTIPVVFHIITDGAGAENISAATVQAQLDQLNLDFRNLAGSTDPVAADVEVQFCLAQLDPSDNVMAEPGINRVTTLGDGPFGQNDFEGAGGIKQQTQWDPDSYMNIWVADLSGGLLGYAQFPDASGLAGMPGSGGNAYEDGVVVGYGTVGSVANPGSAPPYNLGRTLTHEVGHWVGLRHIWGDGGCTQDDFCNDTPDSDGSNFGCPNVTNCGSVDMVENYMDYTDDACMNIFTADQKTRIRTVFSVSPRRNTLPNSTKCIVSEYTIEAQDSLLSACPPANAVYTINIGEFGGYADPVNLTVSGVPAGANAVFGSTSIIPVGSTTLTISNLGAVTPGTYNLTVNATSSSGPQSLPLVLFVSDPAPTTAVTLTSPADVATGVSVPTNFSWGASASAGAEYSIEIATDAAFTNIVDNATGLINNAYTSSALASSTTYYWRVSVSNACGAGPVSSVFSFTTANCAVYSSTNIPVAITATGTPTVTSTLNVPANGTITDLNVTQVQGTHTWINDLTVTLTGPTGSSATLWSNICNDEDDFDIAFDDASANTYANIPCPPTGGGTYQPNSPLSAFNGQLANGTWTLAIADGANQDGGSLNAWAIEVCVAPQANDDAGISAIINPTNSALCDNPFTPEVTLANLGSTTLTSATIFYQIDANAPQSFSWTGSLASGATTNVVLNPITSPVVGTAFTFFAYTANPNGTVDGNNLNDTSSVETIIELATPIPYAENFNNGALPADITILNPNGDAAEWEHTTTASNGGGGNGGSIFLDNFNNDTRNTIDWSILPTFDFTGKQGVIMTFDVAYARYDATFNDTLIVAVNGDCGTLYTPLYLKGGSDLATANDNTNLFSPNNSQWREDTVDLSAYDGLGAVKIAFINQGGYGNAMYIDNINVDATSSCTIISSITNQTDNSCNGDANGSATAQGTNGTAPYTYAWSSGANTATANNLAAGTYTVTVTDNAACETTSTVTIAEPAVISNTNSVTDVDCNGASSGAVSITTTGGTAPYQYNIGSGNQAANTFSGLSAGNYNVTVTDNNACEVVTAVTIAQPQALNAAVASQTDVDCFGSNTGSVTISATGGTAGYQYNIGSGNQAGSTFTNLAAGNYTVTITDANGCQTTQSATITQPAAALSTSVASQTNVGCFGSSTGSVTISVTGGTAGYQFNIGSGNQTSSTFTNLPAGNYSVSVIDANGCITTQAVSITQPSTALQATTNSTGETCTGNDGTATAVASGGTAPFTYNWNTGATTSTISGLTVGSYSVTITDANGCTDIRSVVVANACNPCTVSSTVSSVDVSCNGLCDGNITITPTAGTAPYSYSWNDGSSGAVRNNLCAGAYVVTIVDNAGCVGAQSVIITEPTLLTATAASNSTACVASSGTATASVSGGTANYTFLWDNNATTATINNLDAGTYIVTITDNNGCTATASTTIAAIPLSPSSSISASNPLCNGSSDAAVDLTVSGGSGSYTYYWNDGSTSEDLSGLSQGQYAVTITDANGCLAYESVSITEPSALTVSNNPTLPSSSTANDGAIDLSVSGATAPYSFNWSNGATTEDLSGLASGVYTVTVTDANGCQTTQTVDITVVSVATTETLNNFNVFPNPNTGIFTVNVSLSNPTDLQIELVDVLGRQLKTWSFEGQSDINIPVNIKEQATGMYFLVVRTTSGILKTKKVTYSK